MDADIVFGKSQRWVVGRFNGCQCCAVNSLPINGSLAASLAFHKNYIYQVKLSKLMETWMYEMCK